MTTKIHEGDLDAALNAEIDAAIKWGANTDLDAGQTFTLKDSGGNPIFQMTEGSPDIHIAAADDVIADLSAH